jgi:hypothetical protein
MRDWFGWKLASASSAMVQRQTFLVATQWLVMVAR